MHYKWVSVSSLYKTLDSVLGHRDDGVRGREDWWERGVQIASVPCRKC